PRSIWLMRLGVTPTSRASSATRIPRSPRCAASRRPMSPARSPPACARSRVSGPPGDVAGLAVAAPSVVMLTLLRGARRLLHLLPPSRPGFPRHVQHCYRPCLSRRASLIVTEQAAGQPGGATRDEGAPWAMMIERDVPVPADDGVVLRADVF